MRRIKELLRLNFQVGLADRQIAQSCNMARSTVSEYIKRAMQAGLSWPLPAELDGQEIEKRLFQKAGMRRLIAVAKQHLQRWARRRQQPSASKKKGPEVPRAFRSGVLFINEFGIKQKFKDEITRYNKFRRIALGKGPEQAGEPDAFDAKSYAVYILTEGTITEKRKLLSNLRSRLMLKDRVRSLVPQGEMA